jgi:hypothetical protein
MDAASVEEAFATAGWQVHSREVLGSELMKAVFLQQADRANETD